MANNGGLEEMTHRFKDKVAVVTGSGQGIGRAIALALTKEGARIVTNNRQPSTPGGDAQTTAEQIQNMGGSAVPFFGDVSNFETAHKLIQTAVDEFGRLDILVNNAGTGNLLPNIWNMSEEDWDVCVDSHLKGTFNCTRHAATIMKERNWGRIINTSSVSWLGVPADCNYASAKAGIVGLTWAVAVEMGKYGVTCNAFTPAAATRGNTSDEIKGNLKKAYEAGALTRERYEEMLNPPDPETIGPLIVYLCTDEASYINGQIFDIDGGSIAIYSKPFKKRAIFKEECLWTVEELIRLVPKVLLER
jgi:3-oxoacyl-[acyl-carrier protein] reductase